MEIITADLWDAHSNKLELLNLDLRHFGRKLSFNGAVETVKAYEDNSLVRKLLSTDGSGKVLVIDGGGSRRCALIGDNMAQLSLDNRWEGILLYGCIRDSKAINDMQVGIKAVGTCPIKSRKRNEGTIGQELIIEGTRIRSGQYVYADLDGVLFSIEKLI